MNLETVSLGVPRWRRGEGDVRASSEATYLSDDQVTFDNPAGVMPGPGLIVTREALPPRVVEIKVPVASRADVERLRPIIEACLVLFDLDPGWDSYSAKAPRVELIAAAIWMIASVMSDQLPAPKVIPTNRGGVQFEWHEGDRELEIEVLAENRFNVIYEDEATGESTEREIVGDLSPILEYMAKLIA